MANNSLNPTGGIRQIRTKRQKDGTICFIARDVCAALEINNVAQALLRVDEEDKFKVVVVYPNGKQHVWVVTEPGLYTLIFTSSERCSEPAKDFLIDRLCHPRAFEWNELLSLLPIRSEYNDMQKRNRQQRRHVRRARVNNAPGQFSQADLDKLIKLQKGKCYYCGKKIGKAYTVDHVVPISRGGTNYPENIVIACGACNSSKNNKLPHEWPKGGRLL